MVKQSQAKRLARPKNWPRGATGRRLLYKKNGGGGKWRRRNDTYDTTQQNDTSINNSSTTNTNNANHNLSNILIAHNNVMTNCYNAIKW
eukprot:8739907-Pyramimonas_sp.AAC.1